MVLLSKFVLLLLVTVVVGCGDGASYVSGTIEFDGAPLSEGSVLFESDQTICIGAIQDGVYTMLHKGETPIPIGEYKVTVFPPDPVIQAVANSTELKLVSKVDSKLYPKKYQNIKTSGLTFTPQAGKNDFAIDLSK